MQPQPAAAAAAEAEAHPTALPLADTAGAPFVDIAEAPVVVGLRLSVSAVARRLGIAPATLRTWDRRYGVGPSDHSPGSHRRYNPTDIQCLEVMQNALVHGASPAEAARLALTTTAEPHLTEPNPPEPNLANSGPATACVANSNDYAFTSKTRSPLPMRGAGPLAHGLARAVLALDGKAITQLLRDSIDTTGVITTWDDVARPVLRALAERWARDGSGIEYEHLLTEALTSVMAGVTMSTAPPVTTRPVLLGTMAGEFHALPLRVLTATLAERGVHTTLLGADLPISAITAAITRTAPAALLIWSQAEDPNGPELLSQLPRTRPRTRCYVAGPGWNHAQLPPTITALSSLSEASNVLTAAAGL